MKLFMLCLIGGIALPLAGCGSHRPGNYRTLPQIREREAVPTWMARKIGVTTWKVSGAYVTEVEKKGPAARAGVRPGDLIVEFRDKAVHSPADLEKMIQEIGPGRKATLTLLRGDREIWTAVKIGNRFKGYAEGIEIEAPFVGLKAIAGKGASVVGVWAGWPAEEQLGLKSGAIILELAGKPIGGPGDLNRVLNSVQAGVPVPIVYLSCGKKYVRDVQARTLFLNDRLDPVGRK